MTRAARRTAAWRPSGSIRQDLPMPAALAGQPDPGQPNRRRSRPVVYPAYAQGSCYGTNRSVAAAPGRQSGPPALLLSTTRAAPPSGYHFRRPRSSIARTGRVFRKNRARGRPRAGAGDPERTDATLSSRLRTIGDPQRRHAGVVVDGVTVIAHQPPAAPATARSRRRPRGRAPRSRPGSPSTTGVNPPATPAARTARRSGPASAAASS